MHPLGHEAETLQERLNERVRFDEPLSRHTSLRVGGPADVFVRAGAALSIPEQSSVDETSSLLAQDLRPLLRDDAGREQLAAAMQRLARPDATAAVLAQLTALGCLAAA